LGNDVCQVGEFGTRRRSHRTESHRPVRALDAHPVEEQYVEVEPTGLTERLRDALKSGD
jgi:hypothetical protein|tara:strand:- start:1978 stop:2154 length:177 start_codon:yes stop_codon:yes gene_type:complete